MKSWFFALSLTTLLVFASIARAQSNNGSIAGNVSDSSGGNIPDAKVTVTNTQTGIKKIATSTSSGDYRVTELVPGDYEVSVSVPGFQLTTDNHVIVEVNSTASVKLILKPGDINESVSVEASNIGIETETSNVTTRVTPILVQSLPLTNGNTQGGVRTPIDLVFLTPGTTGNDYNNKIAGGQQEGADILVDGASLNSISGGSFDVPNLTPSVDAIEEFSVATAGLPAEYGRTTGGIVNFVTKSGTNVFHGAAYDIVHNTAFDANSWFNNHYRAKTCTGVNDTAGCRQNYATPADKKHDYGVTLGGPLWIPHIYNGRNKSFFFFSWEQTRVRIGGLNISTVPTTANLAGDFSANLVKSNILVQQNPCDSNNPIYQGEIFDPSTTRSINGVICRSPFRSNGQLNIIPAGTTLSAVALNAAKYFPAPQNTNIVNNFQLSYTNPIMATLETIRVDHNFGPNDKIFVSYNPNEYSGENGSRAIPGPADQSSTQHFFTHAETFSYDHVFSPSFENHISMGGFRFTNAINSVAVGTGVDYPQQLGIANLHGQTFTRFNFTTGSYYNLGAGQQYTAAQNHIELNDAVSYIRGRHSLKFGYDLRYLQFSSINTGGNTGTFTFSPAETAGISTSTVQNGNAMASFLLGKPAGASAAVTLHNPRWNTYYHAVFAQDDFKIFPTLVLNIGLRYDIDAPPTEAHDDSSVFSPTLANPAAGNRPGALLFAGRGPGRSGLSSSFVNTTFSDIAPRVGFSWAPAMFGGKIAFRGSYNVLYGAFPQTEEGGGTQDGFTAVSAYSNSSSLGGFNGAPFTLDKAFPAVPTTISTDPSQLNGQDINYAQAGAKPAKVQIWNLQVQQELAPDLTFTLSYVGNKGTRLSSDLRNINSITPQYWALGSKLTQPIAANSIGLAPPYSGFTGGTVANALRPFPQYLHISPTLETVGQSSYEALWSTLQRRYRNNLTLLVAYSWSKTLTDSDFLLPFFYFGNNVQNPFDLRGEKALSNQDARHNISVSYVYRLPFGHSQRFLNKSGLLDQTVGGWVLGGIQSYVSSFPISFGCANQIPGTDNCVRWNHAGSQYLSAVAGHSGFNPDTDNFFLNSGQTASQLFTDPEAGVSSGGGYQLGNVSRYTTARGPMNLNESFSLSKQFSIARGVRFEVRGEAFNAFNRHAFGAPDSNPLDSGFGVVTRTSNSARQLQVTGRITF